MIEIPACLNKSSEATFGLCPVDNLAHGRRLGERFVLSLGLALGDGSVSVSRKIPLVCLKVVSFLCTLR